MAVYRMLIETPYVFLNEDLMNELVKIIEARLKKEKLYSEVKINYQEI